MECYRRVFGKRVLFRVVKPFDGVRLNSQITKWSSIVGLEIHAQITSNSKLFSRSPSTFAAPPNSQVSHFDASLPGTLPVLNRKCVEAAVKMALALKCTIHKVSHFDRKHYFYADLPVGYQITQQRSPIATGGKLDFVVYNPVVHKKPFLHSARIKQLQLEQDSGRSLHDEDSNLTLIDLNRAGVALMEIVFEPDLSNGEEAAGLIRELQKILRRLGASSGEMSEGAMRIDANISVSKPGTFWGVRTELKNINSARFVAKAIDFEIKRQIDLLEEGGTVINETRMYDHILKKTVKMRNKETLQDYRYMPEPNLPPLRLCDNTDNDEVKSSKHVVNIDAIRQNIPLLPSDDRQRLMEKYCLPLLTSLLLVNVELEGLFEEVIKRSRSEPKLVAQILLTEILSQLNKRNIAVENMPVEVSRIQEIIDLIGEGFVNITKAKDVIELLFNGDARSPKEIVQESKWIQISSFEELNKICQQVIEMNPKLMQLHPSLMMDAVASENITTVKQYQKGKTKALKSLVNHVKVSSENRANTKKAEEILINLLKE